MRTTPIIVLLLCSSIFTVTCQNTEQENLIQVLKGVVEGLAEEGHFQINTIEECVTNSKVIMQDLVQAVNLIKSNSLSGVKDGIKKIGEALQVLPNAIKECRAGEGELVEVSKLLSSLLEELRHPVDFAFQAGKNLIVNGVEILHEVITSVNDWETQNFEDFGRQIGRILYQLLVKAPLMISMERYQSDNIAVDVFVGVLRGFVTEGGVRAEDVASCIGNSTQVVDDLIGAVKDFESKDENKVRNGLKLLGKALRVLPSAILACKATEQEAVALAEKLQIVIDELADPKQFAYHVGKDLIVNGRNIYREVNQSVADWKAQDYSDFGYQVGEILYNLFVGVEIQLLDQNFRSNEVAVTIFVGVLEGFATEGGIRAEDVQTCITDSTFVIDQFILAVQEFESNDAKKILEGLRLLGEGLQVLPAAIAKCKAAEQEAVTLAKKLSEVIMEMAHPTDFAYHIGKDLFVNGRNIYKEITTAVVDWKSQNYNGFGTELGMALYDIFISAQIQQQIQQ